MASRWRRSLTWAYTVAVTPMWAWPRSSLIQCSGSAFLKAGLVGGVIGGLSGLGGVLGGKLLKAVGGKALEAVGGLFGRGSEAVEGAGTGTAEGAAASAEESSAVRAGEEPGAGKESRSPGCKSGPHSFTGSTRVLLADGTTRAIGRVRVGDKVKNAVPGEKRAETYSVEKVIVTTTDHDFVDLTVAPKRAGALVKAAVAVAAGVAAVAGSATLTTTFHHPFYDRTQAAFVEAADLRVGDELQTVTGTAWCWPNAPTTPRRPAVDDISAG